MNKLSFLNEILGYKPKIYWERKYMDFLKKDLTSLLMKRLSMLVP
jgi:hypothetical protein